MSTVRGFISLALLAFALTALVGCVGPMACVPGCGCDGGGCSSLATGCGSGGCGDCSGCGELYVDPWINHPADVCDPCDVCGNHNGQSCGKCRSVFDGARTMWGYRCGSDCGGCDAACDAAPCCPFPGIGLVNAVAGVARAVVTCGTCGLVDCGCDAGIYAGCDTCGQATCGCEVGCDTCGEISCGCEVGCGVCGEVNCGCEGGGYANEVYIGGGYVGGQPTPIHDGVVEIVPAEKPYAPSRTRKIFRARPDIAEAPQSVNY